MQRPDCSHQVGTFDQSDFFASDLDGASYTLVQPVRVAVIIELAKILIIWVTFHFLS
jgi:hypothetical protein